MDFRLILMKRDIINRLVLLFLALFLVGCSQQVKEPNTSKFGNEPSTGWPVKVGLQNEEGLPVTVSPQNKEGLPVRLGLQDGKGLPVELQLKDSRSLPVNLNQPNNSSFLVEIDTKDKQVLPVKVDGLENLEKFLKAFVADINSFSIRLNIPNGSQLPPLQVSLQPISSKVLIAITVSVLAVLVAAFGALLAMFFAWRTSLNMKMIEKKIRNSDIDK